MLVGTGQLGIVLAFLFLALLRSGTVKVLEQVSGFFMVDTPLYQWCYALLV